jgi:hypothetical protein
MRRVARRGRITSEWPTNRTEPLFSLPRSSFLDREDEALKDPRIHFRIGDKLGLTSSGNTAPFSA